MLKIIFGTVAGSAAGFGAAAVITGNWNHFAACCLIGFIFEVSLIGMILEEE